MKIGSLAKRTGLSAHTIRYYERIGLLPRADRDGSGQRDYDASILIWIEFLSRLKTTGMPIRKMLRYADLRAKGTETGPQRRALLEVHREKVREHVAELEACLLILDDKISGYADAEQRIPIDDADNTQNERNTPGTRAAGARQN